MRALIVATSMLAWLAASDHCILASSPPVSHAQPQDDAMPSHCPMHAKQQPSQPQKQNGCADLPCCKNLQATATVTGKVVANPLWLGALVAYFHAPAVDPAIELAESLFCSDTGPPGERSFAELVLQRSVLAHAPPVSLS